MSISSAGSFSTIQCYFCGGAACKYENWKLWVDKGANAFDGLYSNWITNNILAMQRPSTRLMKEYDLVQKFKDAGIGAIFNLQQPGEHTACGDGLAPGSDFSYVPEDWMEAGISYLQYGWVDMDIPHCELILSAVQLMAFLISSGKKVAVHCHAGLGRTGLLIASYLIFDKQMTPIEAQQLVRLARPGSIQNKKQTAFLDMFQTYLTKLRFYYPQMVMSGMMSTPSQTFFEILQNQSVCLHGKEQRKLRWVPKPIYLISKRLKELYQISQNRPIIIDEFEHLDYHINSEEFIQAQSKINCGEWVVINSMDIKLLVQLLLIFFLSIKESLIDGQFVEFLEKDNQVRKNVLLHQRLDFGILTTICVILEIFKTDDDKSVNHNLDLVFMQLAGIFSPERPSHISKDTLQVRPPGFHSFNLNLKLPPMPKFFQDWTGMGKNLRRKMSVPVWNIYETLEYIYKTYHIIEDDSTLDIVDKESGEAAISPHSINGDDVGHPVSENASSNISLNESYQEPELELDSKNLEVGDEDIHVSKDFTKIVSADCENVLEENVLPECDEGIEWQLSTEHPCLEKENETKLEGDSHSELLIQEKQQNNEEQTSDQDAIVPVIDSPLEASIENLEELNVATVASQDSI